MAFSLVLGEIASAKHYYKIKKLTDSTVVSNPTRKAGAAVVRVEVITCTLIETGVDRLARIQLGVTVDTGELLRASAAIPVDKVRAGAPVDAWTACAFINV